MTEWALQKRLQREWASDGLTLNDERLFLVAREVMTDWGVNDAAGRWTLPSIDFLLVDERGRLVVLELKVRIRSRRDCVLALCQVTHMASRFSETFSADLLSAAYRRHARGEPGLRGHSLAEAHAAFYGRSHPVGFTANGSRRVVAATDFTNRWDAEVADFTGLDVDTVKLQLASRFAVDAPGNRPMRRFRDEVTAPLRLAPTVETLLIG